MAMPGSRDETGATTAPPISTALAPDSFDAIRKALASAGCIAPAHETDELLRAAGGDPSVLRDLVRRRSAGEPLAWLTREVVFCDLRLSVEPGVYVPRPQSELIARRAATLLPRDGIAVDLCTGTGALAAFMSASAPGAQVVATEVDPLASGCARSNGVETFEGSLDEPLPRALRHRVDVLTAVVPYVPSAAIALLPRDVRDFEPMAALDGGADGMDLLREVVLRSTGWLRPGGSLLLELGGDQADTMLRLVRDLGFVVTEVLTDAEGDPRGMRAGLG
jgi:release factor glutamine methyltransferase